MFINFKHCHLFIFCIRFYIVDDEEAAQKYGVEFPGLLLLKSEGDNVVKYNDDLLHLNKLQQFIVQYTLKNVFVLGPEDNSPIFSHEIPYLILFMDHSNSSHGEYRLEFEKIGEKLGEKIKFAISDFSNDYQKHIAEACGIVDTSDDSLPHLMIFHTKGSSYDRYVYSYGCQLLHF